MQECLYVSIIDFFFHNTEQMIQFQGIDIPMELNEEDGYWRVTIDLADGNINFIPFFNIDLISVKVFIIINIK